MTGTRAPIDRCAREGYVQREETAHRPKAVCGRLSGFRVLMMAAKGGMLMTRRIGSLSRRTWSLSAVSLAAAALTAVALATPSAGLAAVHSHAVSYPHRSVGNLDCNGRSPIQRAVKPGGIILSLIHI